MSSEPVMQKRHYKYIAYVLSTVNGNARKQEIVTLFAHTLRKTNPKFDYVKFVNACQYNGEQR